MKMINITDKKKIDAFKNSKTLLTNKDLALLM